MASGTYMPTRGTRSPTTSKIPTATGSASYYGMMELGVNTTIVENLPTSFADLNDPQYAGKVSINGDPRLKLAPPLPP